MAQDIGVIWVEVNGKTIEAHLLLQVFRCGGRETAGPAIASNDSRNGSSRAEPGIKL
jgi:hypothetical protein